MNPGDWYKEKEDEARRLRERIAKVKSQTAELEHELSVLKKQLEQAEYVGD